MTEKTKTKAQLNDELNALRQRLADVETAESGRMRLAYANMLKAVSTVLAGVGLNYEAALEVVVRQIAELMGDACALCLLSSDGLYLRPVIYYDPNPEIAEFLHTLFETEGNESYFIEEGITGRAVREGKPILIAGMPPDQLRAILKPEFYPYLDRYGIKSMLALPMIAQGRAIGSLTLARQRDDRPYTAEDMDWMQELANHTALAILNARLFADNLRQAELLREANAALELRVAERTNQLAISNQELETFAYSVSHDLRAPLAAIYGFSMALREDYHNQLDATAQDYLQRIVANTRRMDELIQDMLAYSRLSRAELRLEVVDLNGVLADAQDQLQVEIGQCGAQIDVAENLPPVLAHRTTLIQVIANLLSNAIKFVAPGVNPQVQIWAERSPGSQSQVRLWFADNGIGILAQHQERIFRIFERLEGSEQYPGTGIGLSLVHKGIERMNGRVGVQSEVGKGSRFWLELDQA